MNEGELLAALQRELRKHDFSTFSITRGRATVVVPGCPHCKKQFQSIEQFIEHLTAEVVPGAIEEAFAGREPGME